MIVSNSPVKYNLNKLIIDTDRLVIHFEGKCYRGDRTTGSICKADGYNLVDRYGIELAINVYRTGKQPTLTILRIFGSVKTLTILV